MTDKPSHIVWVHSLFVFHAMPYLALHVLLISCFVLFMHGQNKQKSSAYTVYVELIIRSRKHWDIGIAQTIATVFAVYL